MRAPRLALIEIRSVERIDREAAQQLGEEVGGLLGHHVAGKGYFAELLHGDGVGEEGDVGFAAARPGQRLRRRRAGSGGWSARGPFLVEAEQAVEDDRVQMGQIQLALALGELGKRGVDGIGLERSRSAPARVTATKAVPSWALSVSNVAVGVGFRQGSTVKNCSAARRKAAGSKWQAVDNAVGGQNHQAVGVHVDEGHHHGGFRVGRLGQAGWRRARRWPGVAGACSFA